MDAAVIFARYGSTRLPAKLSLRFGAGSLFSWVVERAQCLNVDMVILATTDRPEDVLFQYQYQEFFDNGKIFWGRGHETDLIHRAIDVAEKFGVERLVRINADSPFFPVEEINSALESEESHHTFQTSNLNRRFPYGVSVEIMTTELLIRANKVAGHNDREHLTRVLYKNLRQLCGDNVTEITAQHDLSGQSLVVDTFHDYVALSKKVGERRLCFDSSWTQAID